MNHKSKNVVYLIASPLSCRDYSRFGIDTWINRGWNVRVLDFTKLVRKDFWSFVDGEQLSFKFSGLSVIETTDEAICKISGIQSKAIFIDLLGESFFEQKLRKLAKQKGKTLKLRLGSIPSQKRSLFKRIQRAILRPKFTISALIGILRNTNNLEADYIVIGGLKSEQSLGPTSSKVILAHNLDYDLILSDKRSQELKNSYILFLDEDACYHSDYIQLGITPCASPQHYFSTMNKGLNAIAKIFSSKLVIAAHPRSDYEKITSGFKFPVKKDATYDLIKNARLIVAHGSTSLQMAILFQKPILLVTTDELENSWCSTTYNAFRSELKKSVINLDHFPALIDLFAESEVNGSLYDSYIENYIKQKGSPDKATWSIVIDTLEEDPELVQ